MEKLCPQAGFHRVSDRWNWPRLWKRRVERKGVPNASEVADAGRHQGGHGGKTGPGASPVLQTRPAEPLDTSQPELNLGWLWRWEPNCSSSALGPFAPWPSEPCLIWALHLSAQCCAFGNWWMRRDIWNPQWFFQKYKHEDYWTVRDQLGGKDKKNSLLGFEKERQGVGGKRWSSVSLCYFVSSVILFAQVSCGFIWVWEGKKNIQRI